MSILLSFSFYFCLTICYYEAIGIELLPMISMKIYKFKNTKLFIFPFLKTESTLITTPNIYTYFIAVLILLFFKIMIEENNKLETQRKR
jgi:hypothetical protein